MHAIYQFIILLGFHCHLNHCTHPPPHLSLTHLSKFHAHWPKYPHQAVDVLLLQPAPLPPPQSFPLPRHSTHQNWFRLNWSVPSRCQTRQRPMGAVRGSAACSRCRCLHIGDRNAWNLGASALCRYQRCGGHADRDTRSDFRRANPWQSFLASGLSYLLPGPICLTKSNQVECVFWNSTSSRIYLFHSVT